MTRALRLFLDPARDGDANMARDFKLWHEAEEGTGSIRVYSWSSPWVTLGRGQSASIAEAVYAGVKWSRRPTGGGAVLHGEDATVSAAIPLLALELDRRAVRELYRAMVRPLAMALSECGLSCDLAEERTSRADPDCFRAAGALDLLDSDGRKVAGCAMAVGRRAVLMQASIPLGRWRADSLPSAYPDAWGAAGFDVVTTSGDDA